MEGRIGTWLPHVCHACWTPQIRSGIHAPFRLSAIRTASSWQPRTLKTRATGKTDIWGNLKSSIQNIRLFKEPVKKVVGEPESEPSMAERKNATLVFVAPNKNGCEIIKEILNLGDTVVVAVQSAEEFTEAQETHGIPSQPSLIFEEGINILDESTLTEKLFSGVSRVILMPICGRPNRDSDDTGVKNIIAAVKKYIPSPGSEKKQIVSLNKSEDLENLKGGDDTFMEGQSRIDFSFSEDGTGVVFTGQVAVEGEGGFCCQQLGELDLGDLANFDGIQMRVKGDGQMYQLKTKAMVPGEGDELCNHQAVFETVENEWRTVEIPWHEFLPVDKSNFLPSAPALDPSALKSLALAHSRFDFNGMANPKFRSQPFRLEIEGGINAFRSPKPVITLVSSGGVERTATIGDDKEKRMKDIPIVKLNPMGVLNAKYLGEIALRESGLPYCILRPAGICEALEGSFLEIDQGDQMQGLINSKEAARLTVHVSKSPYATYKTMEARSVSNARAIERRMEDADFQRLLLKQAVDWRRTQAGLPPFPAPTPSPPPLSEEEVKAVVEEIRIFREENVWKVSPVRQQLRGQMYSNPSFFH